MSHMFVLFLHIASATLLMGGTVASWFALRGVPGAPDLSTLRGTMEAVRRITRFNPLLAIVMLISGAWLGRAGWWDQQWFWVAVTTWFVNLGLAVRFVKPGHQSLGMAAAQAGDGPVTANVDALRRAWVPAIALDVMIGLDSGTLLLMVARPDDASALLWPALGVALACAVRITGSIRGAEPPVPSRARR